MATRVPVMIMLLLLVVYSIGLPQSSVSESKEDSEKAAENVPQSSVSESNKDSEKAAENVPPPPEGEKFLFPMFQFTAAIRPPAPPVPPPRPPPQTLVIPPGTELSVNSQQPFVVHQQGTTVINTGK